MVTPLEFVAGILDQTREYRRTNGRFLNATHKGAIDVLGSTLSHLHHYLELLEREPAHDVEKK